MDVDGDVDGNLVHAFDCMGTVDREVLIRQFQQLISENHVVSPENCAFFLDMNNWNLQAALGSYYDYGSNNMVSGAPPPEYISRLPSMLFIQDVTIGEVCVKIEKGESIPPLTRFTKTWRIRNPGADNWPEGCFLLHSEGEQMADTNRMSVPALMKGTEGDVSIEMTSPLALGIYQSRWQLNSPEGLPFGESIWIMISVEDTGLLGITQQLASAPIGSLLSSHKADNPFGGMHAFPSVSNQRDSKDEEFASRPSSSCPLRMDACCESSLVEMDIPASPNGSSALYQAVVAALPQQCHPLASPSTPLHILRPSDPPDVPPCTPCTPPDRMQS